VSVVAGAAPPVWRPNAIPQRKAGDQIIAMNLASVIVPKQDLDISRALLPRERITLPEARETCPKWGKVGVCFVGMTAWGAGRGSLVGPRGERRARRPPAGLIEDGLWG
jgi:hypothetical protein